MGTISHFGPANAERFVMAVCTHFNISIEELRGKDRRMALVTARRCLAYLLVHEAGLCATEAGRIMGRDRSTVEHHVAVVESARGKGGSGAGADKHMATHLRCVRSEAKWLTQQARIKREMRAIDPVAIAGVRALSLSGKMAFA